MKKMIEIAELLGTDIRSRINSNVIRREIGKTQDILIDIDMGGVVFISRSFADELLEIAEKTQGKHVSITNSAGEVKSMLEIAARDRKRERVYPDVDKDTEVVRLKDMASLKEFFAAI